MIKYIKELFSDIWNLLQGMRISMLNFCRRPITEEYPENRGTKQYAERFRGELVMPHNENNEHKCIACGLCMMNCPNGSIQIIKKDETTEDGKTKKVLAQYLYNIGSCTFCGLCTTNCKPQAIEWSNNFEHSTFTKKALIKQLNREGSKLEEKKEKPQQ
jgi:NADH-quinone oxidoreductase subunit I